MIFCSRRVFLNVVTQLLDLDTLLNANYYLTDQVKPTGYAAITDEPRIGTDGEMTYNSGLDFSPLIESTTGLHQFFISYSRIFDVSPYIGALSASMRNDFSSPEERFISHLNNPEAQIAVYQELFQKRLQGNNLQIVIMKDDRGVQLCGHIICTFLADMFGADVTFIDPKYRPKTPGKLQYIGNKDFGKQHIMEIRDMIFRIAIQSAVDAAGYGNGEMNLMTFFENADLTIEDLFHAYHLLFPNDQLPPGNYSIPHMKQLIIGRLMDSTGRSHERKSLQDLGVNFYAFDQMMDSYASNIPEEDFSDVM